MQAEHRNTGWISAGLLGLLLTFMAPSGHAVVKNVSLTGSDDSSLANTRVTIVFPDGSEQQEETDDKGVLIFDFPTDGDYSIRYPGGEKTVSVTGAGATASAGILAQMGNILPTTNVGGYVGFGVGYNDHDDVLSANNDGSLSNISNDDSSTGWSVIGGYFFNDWVGLEVGYLDLGEPDFTADSDGSGDSWVAGEVSTDFEADGWLFAIIGRWPITDQLALLGRLGWYAWDTTETWTENGFVSSESDSGSDAYYGVGFEYDVGTPDKWVIRGDIAQTEVDDDGDTVNMLSASAVRKF